jgi:peptidoglycan/xylan/chitin deacetylase (PgdA/CDA1 family)
MFQNIFNRTIANALPPVLGVRGKQRLSILIYHRILSDYDYMREVEPTIEQFGWQMELLSNYFNPLSLPEALRLMDAGRLPERAVCVTFDDGYADNAHLAAPVLRKWNIPATIFIATKYLDGGIMWNDAVIELVKHSEQQRIDLSDSGLGVFYLNSENRKSICARSIIQHIKYRSPCERDDFISSLKEITGAQLPVDLMLSTAQVRALAAEGLEIGGHTDSHPILCSMQERQAREEIAKGKARLEEIIGSRLRFFAYPNGVPGKDYSPVHTKMVAESGFEAAVSTKPGVSDRKSDRMQLSRFTPWDSTPSKFLIRLLSNIRVLNA